MAHAPSDDGDLRRNAPAAARNAAPIAGVLAPRLADARAVLEIASGTGEHALAFSQAMAHLTWQPSDPDADARASIAAWSRHSGANLPPPLDLDVTRPGWTADCPGEWDAIVCINMIHIAPWLAAEGLITGAARALKPGGSLILYGPFMIDGRHTADSNAQFDASLRLRNAAWGVRDMTVVASTAAEHGLTLTETIAMPANNLTVVLTIGDAPRGRP